MGRNYIVVPKQRSWLEPSLSFDCAQKVRIYYRASNSCDCELTTL